MLKFASLIVLAWTAQLSCAREWWQNGNFYQVYPRSFKDSDGNGIGDLKGKFVEVINHFLWGLNKANNSYGKAM